MKVGDIVRLNFQSRRTDSTALVVERFDATLFWVVWTHSGEREQVYSDYFEVISAAG